MSTLRLFFLGGMELRCDGVSLAKPPTVKSQSLLAYLVLHRDRPHQRESLAGIFWGDRPERKARRSLTTALWHIRRCLPEAGYLLTDPQTVQFDPQAQFWLDVAEFESRAGSGILAELESAADLYGGDLLEGFFDDWIITARYRLDTLYCDVLARLMAGQEAAGEQRAALSTALGLLDRDPLREDAHRLAMRALCRLGQRNAALEQYRRCLQTVGQELGAEPMLETTALYQAILDGRWEIGQPAGATLTLAPQDQPPLAPGYSPLEATAPIPLVGRKAEMAFLRDRCQEAEQGRGGLLLISGEAGVGKSRLVGELARQLRWQGACVLWGRCFEFERVLPYQPVAEALRGVVSTMTRPALEEHPAWVLLEVARLVPELLEKLPGLDLTSAGRSEQERMRLFEGLLRFLAALAARGRLLMVLEDLHWASESTLQLLHYLVRHLAGQGVLVLGTLRPEAVGRGHPLLALRQELDREGLTWPLGLGPLSMQAVDALVGQMSGVGEAAVPLARRLYDETEGNPFFLMEAIKALFEAQWIFLEKGRWRGDLARITEGDLPLPAGVSSTIQARVRGLDDAAQEALSLGAVLGREFDFELLEAVWGRGEEATLEALDQLLRRRLVEEGSGVSARDYAFTHHKIQEVIYRGIPERHRQRIHGQAGLAMERLYGPELGDLASELAFHFQQGAGHDESLRDKATEYLLRAGDRARLSHSYQEAAEHYRQAVAWLRIQGRHAQAASTLMKMGLTFQGSFDLERAGEAYGEGFLLWQRAAQSEPLHRLPAPHALRSWQIEPVTLEPAEVTDWHSGVVLEQLFSCLIRFGPDMEVLPEAAKSWEILDGGRTYIFHLREDARWSDGVPVTAHDLEYAWKRLLDPARGPNLATTFYGVKGARSYHRGEVPSADSVAVRSLDDLTLLVELETPDLGFLYLTLYAVPVPRHVVELYGDAWTEPGRMVSNGPFRLESWERGKSMVLARNPEYHGHFQGNLQRVHLFLGPKADAFLAYDSDRLDILTLDSVPMADMDRLRRQHTGEWISVPSLYTYLLRFDLSRAPFNDCRVRRAFAMATDRSRLADVVLGGLASPAAGGLVPPIMAGHSPALALPHSPWEARKELAEAGYPDGRGFPAVELLLSQGRESVVDDLVAQWRANLGVAIAGRTVGWAGLIDRSLHQPPHILGMGWGAHFPDPATFVGPARRDDGHASHTWQNAAYDELAREAVRATDQAERVRLYRQMDRIVVEEAWLVPLWYGRRHLLAKPWVVTLPTSPTMGCFWKDVTIEPH